MTQTVSITYRPMTAADLPFVPLECQGEPAEVRERITVAGSSAMLAFDGERCVAQLQFRPYAPGTRSPAGIHHPLYWMDHPEGTPPLPARLLCLFCYHVGQVEGAPDQREGRYQGRGIGRGLLLRTIQWAGSQGFDAIVAKGLAACWPVIQYLGGMPWSVYEQHGFTSLHSYHDSELRDVLDEILVGAYGARRLMELTDEVERGADLDVLSEVRICVRRLRPG